MSAHHGIYTIDTHFQQAQFDAAYLLVENGCGVFIDCGTSQSVPYLLESLHQAKLEPADIHWLIVTHVHLDHAGGAGALLQQLPNAKLWVHPRGAPHMIDPTRLIAGATAVYGEAEMARSYGQIVPIARERVVIAEDGQHLSLAGRQLLCLHTPGHARHHLCIWDEASRSWFAGDTFGLSYRELDSARGAFIIPTSSPVQFEPQPLHQSIDRLLQRQPQTIWLTHFGGVQEIARLADDLHHQIDAMTALARAANAHNDRHHALVRALSDLYLQRAQAHGCVLDDAAILQLLETDIELNAQGLACWLDRK